MPINHPLLATMGFLLIVSPISGSENANAFNLKKMMESVAPPQSSGDESKTKKNAGPGGLFGGSKSGSLFGSGGNPLGAQGGGDRSSSDKSDPYQGSTALRFACEKFKKTSALYGDASKSSLEQWSDLVLQDIGKPPGKAGRSDTLAIMTDPFSKFNGLKWAVTPGFYVGSFISKKIKMEIELWDSKLEERLNIAGRLRKAANDPNLGDEDRADAKFAYALVLAHFEGELKSKSIVEGYLKSAWNEEAIGALYVRGLRMYKGLSYPKDVNGAENYVFGAYQKIEEIIEKAEEDGEHPPELWDEPEKLWSVFATDPEYKKHKRFQSLAAQASKIRASIQKEVDKGAGDGAIGKEIKRLDTVLKNSEMLMAKAFNAGKELAEENKSVEDLLNKADNDAQVVRKAVVLEDNSREKLHRMIENNDQTLGPEGIKLAKQAQQGAQYVSIEVGKIFVNTLPALMSGGFNIGETVAYQKLAMRTRHLSCKLNQAIVVYTEKKSLRLDPKPLGEDPEQLKLMSQAGGAS